MPNSDKEKYIMILSSCCFFYLAAVNAKGSLLCIERSPIVIHTGLSSCNKMEAKTKITWKIIPVIPNDNQSMKIYLINVAIRSTYFIFCCRNRNWDSPDLMQLGFFLFCFVLCFVFMNNSISSSHL